MAPTKVRETANSRKGGELSGLPPPARQKPKPPVNTVMQRFSLRKETLPQPLPANPRTSVIISDNINSNSVAQRNMTNMTNEPESSWRLLPLQVEALLRQYLYQVLVEPHTLIKKSP